MLAHGWTYDDLDRLTTATFPAAAAPLAFTYRDNDDLETLTHGNGLVTSYAYFPEGPIDTITLAGAGTLLDLDYTIDEILNITDLVETFSPGGPPVVGSHVYGYDFADRLTGSDYTGPDLLPAAETFGYDAAGNRDELDHLVGG